MTSDGTFDLISISDVIAFVRRHIISVVLCVGVGGACGFKGSGYIPKKYKSKAIVTIQSGYFHHPLVSDTVAEIQDTAEMSAHRLALVRTALTDQFLLDFNNTYLAPNHATSSSTKPVDLESVLKRIEYFSTNPTSFQVSITLSSPDQAFHATQSVVNKVISTLRAKREEHLTRSKRALEHEAEILINTSSLGARESEGGSVEAQLGSTKDQLATLEEHLAATHPDVIVMRNRLGRLEARQQEAFPSPSNGEGIKNLFVSPQSTTTMQEIIGDLLKKISHINIVLAMEGEEAATSYVDIIEHPRIPMFPFAPNRIQCGLIGAVAGLIFSLSIAVARELSRRSVLSPEDAARYIEVPLLGELPDLTVIPPPCSTFTRSGPINFSVLCIGMSISCAG